MSFSVFFDFSTGLNRAIVVPEGTIRSCQDHVRMVEQTLGFEVTQYKRNPPHWKSTTPKDGVTDKVLCETAIHHNRWVRHLYDIIAKKTAWVRQGKTEKMTPRDARTFWHGLTDIHVPVERWTTDYYANRMAHLYEVMRGREHEGVAFDVKALTPRQAAQVIVLFSTYIDDHDIRLDVPKGHDDLARSDTGEYAWCERASCGAVHQDDWPRCRKRGCPVKLDYGHTDPEP